MIYSQKNQNLNKNKVKCWLNKNIFYLVFIGIFIFGVFIGIAVSKISLSHKCRIYEESTKIAETQIKRERTEKKEKEGIEYKEYPDEKDAEMLAKLLWGEARGVKTTKEKEAVAWCVLNRVDSKDFPDTVKEVIEQKNQFEGYKEDYPIEKELYKIACEVLKKWSLEKSGKKEVGRVLPKEYLFFTGDGEKNTFTKDYKKVDEIEFEIN